jgi:hypothetical protein
MHQFPLPPPPPPVTLGEFGSTEHVRDSWFKSRLDFTPLHQNHQVDEIKRPRHEPKSRRRPFIEPSDGVKQCRLLEEAQLYDDMNKAPSYDPELELLFDDIKTQKREAEGAKVMNEQMHTPEELYDPEFPSYESTQMPPVLMPPPAKPKIEFKPTMPQMRAAFKPQHQLPALRMPAPRPTGVYEGRAVQLLNAVDSKPLPDTWEHACLWDTYEFKTKPVSCPLRYDEKRNIYYMFGAFCSWNCARAWGALNAPAMSRPFVGIWIANINRQLLRSQKKPFVAEENRFPGAPSPTLLSRFTPGGLTIEQYRSIHCYNVRVVTIQQDLVTVVPLGVNVFTIPKKGLGNQLPKQVPPKDTKLPWTWDFLTENTKKRKRDAEEEERKAKRAKLSPEEEQDNKVAAEKKKVASEKKQRYELFKKPVSQRANMMKYTLEREKPVKENPLTMLMKIKTKPKETTTTASKEDPSLQKKPNPPPALAPVADSMKKKKQAAPKKATAKKKA